MLSPEGGGMSHHLDFDKLPEHLKDIHDLFKASGEAFKSAADLLAEDDPVVMDIMGWTAAAIGMAHVTFDRRLAERIASNN